MKRCGRVSCLPALALSMFFMWGCSVPGGAKASNNSFDFGQVVVSQTSTRDVVTITNTARETATLSASLSGDSSLKLRSDLSCGSSLVAGGVCAVAVSFAPQTSGSVDGTLSVTLTSGSSASTKTVQLTGTGAQLSGGESQVTATGNPVVALYSFQPEQQGMVHVEFGTDIGYGRSTNSVATPANEGPVSILVAGMKQGTTYHMRAVLTESDGTVVDDQDHTFTTGSFPSGLLPQISVTTSPGKTPQPGIEMLDGATATGNKYYLEAYAVDLQGNVIWGYNFPDHAGPNTIVQPIKLMPNGNLLVELSFASQFVLPGQGVVLTPADKSVDLIREINLAGDPVAQITMAQLNAKLAAAGYNWTLLDFHHDVAILPNGHIVAIAEMIKPYTNLPGYTGTTNVLGDVLIDLDQNFNVSWVWNEFDHLDVNRHPIGFPDWTHTNAVFYSPEDGDLLVSMRHQSWIIEIDYENGKGSGDILWRLGNEGDFTLKGGTAPQDWFYGEHDPRFTPNGAGAEQFSLTMMDNGYGRITSSGMCTGTGAACYTTAPILAVDEATKTATITFRDTLPASKFSIWGGSGTQLANGDLEYDLCALSNGSEIDEVTTTNPSQPVWTMTETGENLYRAHRLPSLYPGVQW